MKAFLVGAIIFAILAGVSIAIFQGTERSVVQETGSPYVHVT